MGRINGPRKGANVDANSMMAMKTNIFGVGVENVALGGWVWTTLSCFAFHYPYYMTKDQV